MITIEKKREKIVILRQYIRYYSITSLFTEHLYNKKL